MTTPHRLPLLLGGVVVGAIAAVALAARDRTTSAAPPGDAQLLALTDEQHWVFEASARVHRTAGAVAGHLHTRGGLPGLVVPLEGPPMSRVDWQEPGGALLRYDVHELPGSEWSEVHVKAARGSRSAGRGGLAALEVEVRSQLGALRKELERAR